MSYTPQQIESLSLPLRQSLGDNIPWQYEDKFDAMLSEFAQNKSDVVLAKLRENLTDEWCPKTAKKLPSALKQQLKTLSKISKNQRILATPGNGEQPTVVALWWPWGHGGTYSLRILLLNQTYQYAVDQQGSLWQKLKQLLS